MTFITPVESMLIAGAAVSKDIASIELPEFNFGYAGAILLGIGLIAAGTVIYRQWRDVYMVRKDRNDKAHALLLDILTDGVLDAEVKGVLSTQEADQLFLELQQKLGLDDLIPKKRMQAIIKAGLKRAKGKREDLKRRGKYKKPNIPGDKPPQEITSNSFEESSGNVAKFRQNTGNQRSKAL